MGNRIKIALAGNPNSGKTTLFNALTGSNQFVGNWPGVTVEKKEGKLKKRDDVIITDLPGIYSLSPYTLEEVVARNYLIGERPDVILNILDGTNLERNLYLTTQLTELGIPVVIVINMMDIVRRRGDKINIEKLSKAIGCKIIEISALKNDGIAEAAEAAIEAAQSKASLPAHTFSGTVEHALAHIEEAVLHHMPPERQRWYAIKIFERDEAVRKQLAVPADVLAHVEDDIVTVETELDDDSESIITNERYIYIAQLMCRFYKKKSGSRLSTSDKIDKVVTNRILALPIFALVMFVVYFLSVTTVGTWATDWANEGLFGDGWHLLGIGSLKYKQAAADYAVSGAVITAFEEAAADLGADPLEAAELTASAVLYDENGNVTDVIEADYQAYILALTEDKPNPDDYGVWVTGIPVLADSLLNGANVAGWLHSLIMNGIIAGVGAVLGFVPQMVVLFLLLAFLEACGYMARVAFIMDRIFRKFNLSGKSFIPMLISTGCTVPGVMASRTIENERDRRMTIMTTPFVPCGAKLPIIALIAGAMFGRAWWVAPSAYFVGISAIIISGIILKKTRMFAGDPAPFVMELPAYQMPTAGSLFRSTWERAWSFIKKAGTVILLSAILLWFLMSFGFEGGGFGMTKSLENSILARLGSIISWVFIPLGFGNWQSAVATVTGLIAKENVVSTFGVLFGGFDGVAENGWQIWNNMRTLYTPLASYSFLLFNLLCAPCFAAIGAISREMNSPKWTLFAVGYQTLFAYATSLIVYQFGMLFTGKPDIIGLSAAALFSAVIIFMLVKPDRSLSGQAKRC